MLVLIFLVFYEIFRMFLFPNIVIEASDIGKQVIGTDTLCRRLGKFGNNEGVCMGSRSMGGKPLEHGGTGVGKFSESERGRCIEENLKERKKEG